MTWPSSCSRESTTRESGCRQYGQRIGTGSSGRRSPVGERCRQPGDNMWGLRPNLWTPDPNLWTSYTPVTTRCRCNARAKIDVPQDESPSASQSRQPSPASRAIVSRQRSRSCWPGETTSLGQVVHRRRCATSARGSRSAPRLPRSTTSESPRWTVTTDAAPPVPPRGDPAAERCRRRQPGNDDEAEATSADSDRSTTTPAPGQPDRRGTDDRRRVGSSAQAGGVSPPTTGLRTDELVPPTIEVDDPGAEGGGSWRSWTEQTSATRRVDDRQRRSKVADEHGAGIAQRSQRTRTGRGRDVDLRRELGCDRHRSAPLDLIALAVER